MRAPWTPIFVLVVVVSACGDDDASRDGGVDASVLDGAVRVDGGIRPDAASDAAPATDAGGGDAQMTSSCGGLCDPRGGRCAGGTLCVLVDEEPSCAIGTGTRTEGERCSVPSECVAGTTCFRRREGGVCGRVCCGDSSAPTCGDDRCGGAGVLVDGSQTAFGECLPTRPCDVLGASAECQLGESCFLVGERGETDCRVPGEATIGEACEIAEDCVGGATCTGLFERTCVRVCRLESEGSCPAGEGTCVAYAQSPPGTGLCTVMASVGG